MAPSRCHWSARNNVFTVRFSGGGGVLYLLIYIFGPELKLEQFGDAENRVFGG